MRYEKFIERFVEIERSDIVKGRAFSIFRDQRIFAQDPEDEICCFGMMVFAENPIRNGDAYYYDLANGKEYHAPVNDLLEHELHGNFLSRILRAVK